MPRDIKVKEKDSKFIRKLDRSIAFTSRVKRNVQGQYEKSINLNQNDVENSNASNYATLKIMRASERGAKESTYTIYGVSKTAYKKAKMKIAEKKKNKDTDIATDYPKNKQIKTTKNYENKKLNNEHSSPTKSLIKEKSIKRIKEHNSKNIEIKTNENPLKIKTRANMEVATKLNANNKVKLQNSSNLIKKPQSIKSNIKNTKNTVKNVGKSVVNITKRIVQRTKRTRCIYSFWWWYGFSNYYRYFTYC